jgi:hypothetical protein
MTVLSRWAAAFVSVLVVALPATARAAVIYVDLVPDRVVSGGTFIFDIDNDGTKDLLFDSELGCVGNCLSRAQVGGIGGGVVVSFTSPFTAIAPLTAGTTIGGASTFSPQGLFAQDSYAGVPPVTFAEEGLWDNGLTAFLGFSFLIGAETHYGWARVNIEETTNAITVFDVGYESVAGSPIRAGSVPEPGSVALVCLGVAGWWRRRAAGLVR